MTEDEPFKEIFSQPCLGTSQPADIVDQAVSHLLGRGCL